MSEWILKYLTPSMSVKTAIKLFLTIVLVVAGWDMANSFFKDNGVPDYIGHSLWVMLCFCASVIAIEAVFCAYEAIKKKLQTWQVTRESELEKVRKRELDKAKKIEDEEVFRRKVNLTFLHLDKASQKLLRELFERGNIALTWNEHPTNELHKMRFINCIGDVNGKKKIYELNPILNEYLSHERENNIAELSRTLDENSKQFLRIFFDKVIPFGVSGQEIWMNSLAYKSHEIMLQLKAIQKHDDTFILSSNFQLQLIRDGHFDICYRTKVTLDPHLIEAYIPTRIGPKI